MTAQCRPVGTAIEHTFGDRPMMASGEEAICQCHQVVVGREGVMLRVVTNDRCRTLATDGLPEGLS